MNTEMINYLNQIEIGKDFMDKLIEIYKEVEVFFPETIIDIYLNEHQVEEKIGFYSIWFFSKNFASEFFLQTGVFDMVEMNGVINRIEFTPKNFDLKNTQKDSRIFMRVTTRYLITGEFLASYKNCAKLLEIYQKHFKSYFSSVAKE